MKLDLNKDYERLNDCYRAEYSNEHHVLQRLPLVRDQKLHQLSPEVRALVEMLKQTENPYQVLDIALDYFAKITSEMREELLQYRMNETTKITFK